MCIRDSTVRSTFFDPVNSLVTGDKTEADWIDQIKKDSDALRAALKAVYKRQSPVKSCSIA